MRMVLDNGSSVILPGWSTGASDVIDNTQISVNFHLLICVQKKIFSVPILPQGPIDTRFTQLKIGK